jgi:hypothetical protein
LETHEPAGKHVPSVYNFFFFFFHPEENQRAGLWKICNRTQLLADISNLTNNNLLSESNETDNAHMTTTQTQTTTTTTTTTTTSLMMMITISETNLNEISSSRNASNTMGNVIANSISLVNFNNQNIMKRLKDSRKLFTKSASEDCYSKFFLQEGFYFK